MSVHLTPEIEQLIQSKVQSGPYRSASEVVTEALRLMDERDEMLALRKQDVAKQIDDGLESLRMGKGLDGEAVFDRIDAELDALERDGNR